MACNPECSDSCCNKYAEKTTAAMEYEIARSSDTDGSGYQYDLYVGGIYQDSFQTARDAEYAYRVRYNIGSETRLIDDVVVKDSGERQEFDTGSRRDTQEGKGRYDLLQCHAIYLVARQLEEGAKKYGDRNWQKGQPLSRYMSSALRHLFKHLAGQKDERHDVAAAWNILSMIETEHWIDEGKLPVELDDLR